MPYPQRWTVTTSNSLPAPWQTSQVSTPEAVVCSSIWPPTGVLSWQAVHIERIGSVVEMTYPELQDSHMLVLLDFYGARLLHRFQGRFKQGLGIG